MTINCAGFPDSLLESEMFGHVKGSFTDAYRDKRGWLEQAHGGTIFMDEVGEMSLRMQAMMLRFLETGEIQRVGADGGARHVNVRIIGATHRNLREMIARGAFREDLFYRLNVIQIRAPALRAHKDDLPELVRALIARVSEENGVKPKPVEPEAMQILQRASIEAGAYLASVDELLIAVVVADQQRAKAVAAAAGFGESADDELLALNTLYFEPVVAAAGLVGAIASFADNAFQTQLTGVLKKLGPTARDVLAVADPAVVIGAQPLGQQLLASHPGQAVVTGPPVVFGGPPERGDPPPGLEPVQGGVERPVLDLQDRFRTMRDDVGDGMPVRGADGEGLEDEQVKRALQ